MDTPAPDQPAPPDSVAVASQPLVHHDRSPGTPRIFTLTATSIRIEWKLKRKPIDLTLPLDGLTPAVSTKPDLYMSVGWNVVCVGLLVAFAVAMNLDRTLTRWIAPGILATLVVLCLICARRILITNVFGRNGGVVFDIIGKRKDDPAHTAFVTTLVAAISAANPKPPGLSDEDLEAQANEPGAVSFHGRLTVEEHVAFSHALTKRYRPWRLPGILVATAIAVIAPSLVLLLVLKSPWPAVIALAAAAAIAAKFLFHWHSRFDRFYRAHADAYPVTDLVVNRRGLFYKNSARSGIIAWPDVQRVDLLACGIGYHARGDGTFTLPNRILSPEVEAELADLHRAAGVAVYGRR